MQPDGGEVLVCCEPQGSPGTAGPGNNIPKHRQAKGNAGASNAEGWSVRLSSPLHAPAVCCGLSDQAQQHGHEMPVPQPCPLHC